MFDNYKKFISGVFHTLIISSCLIYAVPAQIAVDLADLTSLFGAGNIHYGTNFEGSVNIGSPGANQIYDFSYLPLMNELSNTYETNSIPTLASRYPMGAVTFGETPQTVEKNPVFLFSQDAFYIVGEASLVPEWRFKHRDPYDVFPLPVIYGGQNSRFIKLYDSTFTTSGQFISADTSSSEYRTTVDGWGTLKVGSMEFPCLRVKREYIQYGDKDFVYLTKNGAFVTLQTSASSPDFGTVEAGGTILLASSLVGVKNDVLPPVEFSLAQNYPNPFNPTTVIRFTLPSESYAKLEVFNSLGESVGILIDGEMNAGFHSVQFDVSNLSSGVYIYKLTSAGQALTRKMTVMK